MSNAPRRDGSWIVQVEKAAAAAILEWPPELATAITRYFRSFALEAGDAYARGRKLPGDPLDESGLRFSRVVDRPTRDDESILFEYVVVPAERAIRVTIVVWYS
ncbi:hypothetical protein [Streptomyces nanshensis]|uniref:Uncharacterized protein n=1 Tax=Streptomyces nanshensis TaxID=518642 RepID=A0A1E7L570_9ACTN|nr:hypothetical protein [Streptomyces nanshensis]OEV11329.1 hypothetical protein AN218_13330 [Streptomyces nanshensis]